MNSLLETTDAFEVGNSLEITDINPNTAKDIAERAGGDITEQAVADRLGTRIVGSRGIVTKLALYYGSLIYEVGFVDDDGHRNGAMGIVFSGEAKRIPNILVHS